ncbi:MAG: tetratricopeptide repeat protein [Leptospirales bacterium]|nr:tetratricopeptide repeat protein [Leptospirales bacterium]
MKGLSVPKDAVSAYNNGCELAARGDLSGAIEEYRRAIRIYPEFIQARSNIGELYSQLGDSNKAMAAYQDALNFSREYELLFKMGIEHYKAGRTGDALRYFAESIEEYPDFKDANYYAGLILYKDKKYAEAEICLSRVLKSDPSNFKTNFMLSYIYYENKQYHKVIQCLDRMKENSVNDDVFLCKYYGFCYYHIGDYKMAADYLATVLEAHPEYERFKDYLNSLTYENKVREIGDLDNAIKHLEEKMMEESIKSIGEASELSMLYIFRGENQKAEDMLLEYKEKAAS